MGSGPGRVCLVEGVGQGPFPSSELGVYRDSGF